MKSFGKILLAMVMVVLVATTVFAGMPAGQNPTGGPPTTMIGPLNGTKMELADASAGYTITAILALNTSAAVAFIEFWDQPCAGVTLGTTKPSWIQPVPTNGWSYVPYDYMLAFYTPICVVSVTVPNGTVGSAASVFMQTFIP